MSSEIDINNFTDCLEFAFEQFLKQYFFCLPAIIISYDSSTKRAEVQPGIKIRTKESIISQAPILDVPIIFPSGGGYCVLMPLKAGDTILLLFSQRGIAAFKQNFTETSPDDNLFEKSDAIGIAGFGDLTVSPVDSEGINIQDSEGLNYITLGSEKMKLNHAAKIQLEAPSVEITAGTILVNGDDLLLHKHSQGPDSGGASEQDTSTPVY
jgi:hypothetical protein